MTERYDVVVVGAGTAGLGIGWHLQDVGRSFVILERGRVGEHVRRWGHVRLFSSWRLDRSTLGDRELGRVGLTPPPDAAYPTGDEYVERYLLPLARGTRLAGRVHEETRVVRIGRERIGKGDLIGGGRERFPFRLLVESASGEELVRADVVLDCAGTYFITGDFRPLGFDGNDVDFCRHITVEAGVTAVPVSAFYISGEVDHFVRFCFCKRDQVLDDAIERLARAFS